MILSRETSEQLIEWTEGDRYFAALRLPSGGCLCGAGFTTEDSHENLRVGLENLAEGPVRLLERVDIDVGLPYKKQACWVGIMGGDPASYACTVGTDGNLVWGRGDTRVEALFSLRRELAAFH